MLQVANDVNQGFMSFLKSEIASVGLEKVSLKKIFSMYIEKFFSGTKYLSSTSMDRQSLKIDLLETSNILNFKYFIENNEYLEVEAIIEDDWVKITYAESPELYLLYDSELPIVLNTTQFLNKKNDYEMSLADIFELLFKALFTTDSELTVKNIFNLTNIFDRIEPFLEEGDRTNEFSYENYHTNIWVF